MCEPITSPEFNNYNGNKRNISSVESIQLTEFLYYESDVFDVKDRSWKCDENFHEVNKFEICTNHQKFINLKLVTEENYVSDDSIVLKMCIAIANNENKSRQAFLCIHCYQEGQDKWTSTILEYPKPNKDDALSKRKVDFKTSKVIKNLVFQQAFNQEPVALVLLQKPYIIVPRKNYQEDTKISKWIDFFSLRSVKQQKTHHPIAAVIVVPRSQASALIGAKTEPKVLNRSRPRSKCRQNFMELHLDESVDPENIQTCYHDPSNARTVTMETLTEKVKEITKSEDYTLLNKEQQVKALGALATQLFQSTSWKIEPPKSLNFEFGDTTVDIDQVSWTIKAKCKHIMKFVTEDNNINSNDTYIDKLYSIFKPIYPQCSNRITKQSFFSKMANEKAGHTFMDDETRNKYKLIYEKENAVLRVSLAFISSNQSINYQVANSWFNADELKLIDGYGLCDENERIWRALLLVVYRLNSSGKCNQQGFIKAFKLLSPTYAENQSIIILGGEVFYLLVILQLSILEIYFGTKKEISFCLETYGNKNSLFASLNLNEEENQISSLVKQLIEYKANPAITILELSRIIDTYFSIKSPDYELILGLGVTYNVYDNSGHVLFGALQQPPSQKHKSTTNQKTKSNVRDLTSSLLDDHPLNFSKNKRPGRNYNQQNQLCTNIQAVEYDSVEQTIFAEFKACPNFSKFHCSNYFLLSGLLQRNLNPYTLDLDFDLSESKLIRIQHYFVAIREASGESGLTYKVSDLAGNISIRSYTEYNTDSQHLYLPQIKNDHDKFFTCFQETIELIRNRGNFPRVEIAIKVDNPATIYEKVIDGFQFLIQLIRSETRAYVINPIIKTAELYVNALMYKMINLMEVISLKREQIRSIDALTVLTEISAHFMFLYNDRYQFQTDQIIDRKFSTAFGRPLILKYQQQFFLDQANYDFQSLNKGTMEAYLLNQFRIAISTEEKLSRKIVHKARISFQACSICFYLFNEENRKHFDSHFCISVNSFKRLLPDSSEHVIDFYNKSFEELSLKQKYFVNSVRASKSNLFLTGMAGTGKSKTLLLAIYAMCLQHGDKVVGVVSSTKNAAGIVGGVSIHSFFGLTTDELTLENFNSIRDKFKRNEETFARIKDHLKFLFIDEAGLVSADALDIISRLLKFCKCNVYAFGGVRVYLCGDVLQLPPIKDGGFAKFFFESESFVKSSFKVHYLDEIFRQKDNEKWTAILNRVRIGAVEDDDLDFLNKIGKNVPHETIKNTYNLLSDLCIDEMRTKLGATLYKITRSFPYKLFRMGGRRFYCSETNNPLKLYPNKVQEYNTASRKRLESIENRLKSLKELKGNIADPQGVDKQCFILCSEKTEVDKCASNPSYFCTSPLTITARDSFPDTLKSEGGMYFALKFLVEETKLKPVIRITVGQRVMFTSNSVNCWVANNSMGIVKDFIMDTATNMVDTIIVQPLSHNPNKECPTLKVKRMTLSCIYKENQLTRTQFPLTPADAGTLHAVQGMTIRNMNCIFNNERVTLSNSYGVVYMVVSRMVNPDCLYILHPLIKEDICVHPLALLFDQYHCNIKDANGVSDVDYEIDRFQKEQQS